MKRRSVPAGLVWAAGLLVVIGGCGFEPEGDRPIKPPAIYREWWAKTQACSGLRGNFDRVRWSVIDGASFPCSSGQCAGHWTTGRQIILASEWAMDEMVVRHEMLHDLIGRPGHPAPPFGEGCPLTWETWNRDATQLRVGAVVPRTID
jgi:hypothetical protein